MSESCWRQKFLQYLIGEQMISIGKEEIGEKNFFVKGCTLQLYFNFSMKKR